MNDSNVRKYYEKYLQIVTYNSPSDLLQKCIDLKIDAIHYLCAGTNDNIIMYDIPKHIPLFIQNVFIQQPAVFKEQINRNNYYRYGISELTAAPDNNNQFIYHIVEVDNHNDNLRKELNIPDHAIVFGRHGGVDSFNINYVVQVMKKVLEERNDVYFLFAPQPALLYHFKHDRVIYLEPFFDKYYKRKFINTCDAYFHARLEGESFGIAVMEFNICNKPVICSPIGENQHVTNLKDKAIYYKNPYELYNIFINYNKEEMNKRTWYNGNNFTPESVMKQFQKYIIDKIN